MRVVIFLMSVWMVLMILPAQAQPSTEAVDPDAVLARVGDREITVRDFLERYEATPWLGREKASLEDRHRVEFLASMIAEALLAEQAEREGVEWLPAVRRTVDEIERLNVLDALYRQEVMEPVLIDDISIDDVLGHYLMAVAFQYIVSPDAALIEELATAALHGVPFDSLALRVGQDGQYEVRRWGEMAPAVENILYDSLAIGRIAGPVEVDESYYLLKIVDLQSGLPDGVPDLAGAREAVRRTLQWRDEQQNLADFLAAFSRGKDVTVHGPVFQHLAGAFRQAVAAKRDLMVKAGEEPYPLALGGSDYRVIRSEMNEKLATRLVTGPSFEMDVDYVLDRIAFKGFKLEAPVDGVSKRLSGLLQTLIHEEFLAREGYERGLDARPNVRREVERWQQAHLAFTLMKQMAMSRPEGA
ncbi:MAG: peptidylprolyl isomerase, partial [Bacteroidota bacterium]